jgi:hypothetical protein
MRAYRSGSRALQLIRGDRGDGGAPAALVRDPVQRVFGCVLAVAPKTAPATLADTSNKQRSLQGSRSTASPSTLQVHYPIHNSPPTVPILSHINPVHDLPTHLSNNHFNTILPSASRSSKWSLSVTFPHQKKPFVFLFCPIRAARPAHLIVLGLIAQLISDVQRTT